MPLPPDSMTTAPRRVHAPSPMRSAAGSSGPSADPLVDGRQLPDQMQVVKVTHQETHFKPVVTDAVRMAQAEASEPNGPSDHPVAAHPAPPSKTSHASEPHVDVPGTSTAVKSSGEVNGSTNATAGITQLNQQIFDRIVEQEPVAPSTAPTPAPEKPAWMLGPATRLLTLELSPATLGTVKIVLSRVDSALNVKVEAERTETADAVAAGRDDLVNRLGDAGYDIGEVVIASQPSGATGTSTERQDAETPPTHHESPGFSGSNGEMQDPSSCRQRSPAGDRVAASGQGAPPDLLVGQSPAAPESRPFRARHFNVV